MELDFNPQLRHSDLLPADRLGSLKVCLIGAGGIGAPTALALAKIGVGMLEIYDDDDVDDVNLGPQMYGTDVLNKGKVHSLRNMLRKQAPWTTVEINKTRFTSVTDVDHDVVISAVDSLAVRKEIWQAVQQSEVNLGNRCKLLLDPRMGAEVFSLKVVEPKLDGSWYEHSLEGKPVEAPCTARSTFYCGLVAGGLVAAALASWVRDEIHFVDYSLDMRNMVMIQQTRDQARASAKETRGQVWRNAER